MLTNERRQFFRRWRLYEKESLFGTIICYDIENIIHLERYFRPDERQELNDLILDLFFKYEYTWQSMSWRQLAILYWVDHCTMYRILAKAQNKIRESWML